MVNLASPFALPEFTHQIYTTLESFYDRPSKPPRSFGMEGVEGFLCAMASGPPTYHAETWVRLLAAPLQSEGVFEVPMTVEECSWHQKCLISYCRYLGERLARPVATRGLLVGEKRVESAAPWSAGYVLGISLNKDSWAPVVKEHPDWFQPILRLATQHEFALPPSAEVERLAEKLPRVVLYIYRHSLTDWVTTFETSPSKADHKGAGAALPGRATARKSAYSFVPGFGFDQFKELDALYAPSEAWPNRMCLDGIEGCFCALASARGDLHTSRWLPAFAEPPGLGGLGPTLCRSAHKRQMALLMGFYRHVDATLALPTGPLDLVFLRCRDDDVLSNWCAGYMLGMSFEISRWHPLIQRHPHWFEPIFTLAAQRPERPLVEEELEALRQSLLDSVGNIHRLFFTEATDTVLPDS